jgi:hypothetical protein
MRVGSEKPRSLKFILVLAAGMVSDSMPIQDGKPVELLSFYPCMKPP